MLLKRESGKLSRSAAWVCCLGLVASVGAFPAAAQTKEEYEQRISELERRLARLENALAQQMQQGGAGGQASQPGPQAAPRDSAAVQEQVDQFQPELTQEDRDALQDLFMVRDKAVALDKGKWEVSNELSYVRNDAFLQFSRSFDSRPMIRYGFGNGIEVGVATSFNWTHRRTETGTGAPAVRDHFYVGDVELQAAWAAIPESEKYPGVTLTAAVGIPLGPVPYRDDAVTAGTNPMDPFSFYRNASGHYTVTTGAQFFRTYDPFVIFGGGSFTYAFERAHGNNLVFPGYIFGWNVGYSYALTEKTSLGMNVSGQYRTNMEFGGATVGSSGTEAVATRFSMLHRLSDSFYIEPSIGIGLTEDAPDSTLTIRTRKTF